MTEPERESPEPPAPSDPAAEAASEKPSEKAATRPRKKGARAAPTPPDEGAPEASAAAPLATKPAVEGPLFIAAFPADPELQRLTRAFVAGDYATVRAGAEELARGATDPSVKKAAEELRRRIEPDPLAKLLVLGAALLLVVLAGYYWANPHVP